MFADDIDSADPEASSSSGSDVQDDVGRNPVLPDCVEVPPSVPTADVASAEHPLPSRRVSAASLPPGLLAAVINADEVDDGLPAESTSLLQRQARTEPAIGPPEAVAISLSDHLDPVDPITDLRSPTHQRGQTKATLH